MLNSKTILIIVGGCWLTGMSMQQALTTMFFMTIFSFYFLYTGQEGLLYQCNAHPQFQRPQDNPPGVRNPSEQGLPFEEVWLETSDHIRIHSWFIPTTFNGYLPNEVPTLLFLHANAGNMGFRLPFIQKVMTETPCNVFILSYRGYGASGGKPHEEGIMKDAEAAWEHLLQRTDIDHTKILAFGRSLGGAVAIQLASRHQGEFAGVILENTFTSISSLADNLFPVLRIPGVKERMLRLRWESIKHLEKISSIPILFLSAESDQVVPRQHMKELYEKSSTIADASFYLVKGANHNNTWMIGGTRYWIQYRKFLLPFVSPKSEVHCIGILGDHESESSVHVQSDKSGWEIDAFENVD